MVSAVYSKATWALLLAAMLTSVQCLPGPIHLNSREESPADAANRVPQGITPAKDGSVILDTTETVNGLKIRFRISGPAGEFTTASKVPGGGKTTGAQGDLGLHVLLHGDSGQSFFQMPNQGVKNNLAGVAVLSPDRNLHWGGGRGLNRTDGVAHAKAVNDLVFQILPRYMAFNSSNIFFTGVSGGSLMLSGFFIPTHIGNFAGNGVLLGCGAMEPQVEVSQASRDALRKTRIHYQSSQKELEDLRNSIPASIKAYEKMAKDMGMKTEEIDKLQTADNKPDAEHCRFDEKGFDSGIQLIVDNYGAIMQGGNGEVPGIGNVLKGVSGQELKFAGTDGR
ncbi:hypothetical protein CH063_06092 [Colletotrichum higginsianum]|uniref:Cyclin-like f-box protein n=2 Tax=Colletotrichum higginsianum TaxID=80884 RepID=H1V1A8_COLHI|nr:hypothetical protein CH63R_11375 [Colletotrichum higginsianum IMI 349063]OBR04672.1 hypothetical protein CH63R_11375 [Colletotrichum higginsianum IMI 349063]CCF34010.1 hypothetical protein CH063_06092 [Colletotrichum higginsianum]